MKKKIVVLLLATCVGSVTFAGCGKQTTQGQNAAQVTDANEAVPDEEKDSTEESLCDEDTPKANIGEHVVLTMYCIGDEGGIYAEDHLKKINEVLTQKINAEIDPIMVGWGEYKTKLPMVWASGEAYDLTFTGDWVGYFQEASNGAFMDITELFPKYAPKTYAELEGKNLLASTQIDGKLYMVPKDVPDYTTFMYNYREDLRKKYHCSEIVDLDTLEQYLATIKANEPSMLAYSNNATEAMRFQTFLNEQDWSRPVEYGNAGIFCYDLLNPTEVFNIIDTPEYEAYVKQSREYYEKGYWSQSVMAETSSAKDNFLTGKSAIYLANKSNSNGVYQSIKQTNSDWEIGIFSSDLASGYVENVNPAGGGMAIGTQSENPERAMMFIELCHQDEEVYDILMNGLEGITYVADKQTMTKKIPDGVDPTTVNLKNLGMGFGNSKFELGSLNDSPIVKQLMEAYQENVVFPGLGGFAVSQDDISAELAALKSVCDEYKIPLEKGVVDPEKGLDELRQKLKEAGVDLVLEEINKQIAAYRAN